jgi:hypothetical protein
MANVKRTTQATPRLTRAQVQAIRTAVKNTVRGIEG